MVIAKEYSIWLMPMGDMYNYLNNQIVQLSKKCGTPKFEPHVTLLGSILGSELEIISKTAELTCAIKEQRLELDELGHSENYFKCLFIRAKETEDLIKSNFEARKIFDKQTDPKYMPHLSLIYGALPVEKKKEIILELSSQVSLEFDVKKIHLFSTSGEVKDWYSVKEFDLK